MIYDLKKIFSAFTAEGTYSEGSLLGSGHIHDTFYIKTSEAEKDNFVLQRINNKVFRNVPELQDNIERVTRHICAKLKNIPGADTKRESLNLIPSQDGRSWYEDNYGNFWRLFIYITNHRSYDIVDSPEKAFEGGKAIGRFQALLSDLPGKPLYETIPNFHNIIWRLGNLENAIKADKVLRVRESEVEIDFVRKRAEIMKTILKLGTEGRIPLRITHNDTKFNNILLDNNNKALCIIDLDTVMPGYVHYDFGDAIRTAANEAAEDETDLQKVRMNQSLYRAYAEGYLSEAGETLNETEKEFLAFAPQLITYTMAVRFLTDFLEGDVYYKIHNEQHNLQRTKAQLKLIESMEEQYSDMQEIIRKLC